MPPRFSIGIDLGTTNCALAYVDAGAGELARVQSFAIPQVVSAGDVAERPLLPSMLYLPGEGEQPAGALKLPWDASRDWCAGEFAKNFGAKVPTRLVSSAKSWLCHSGCDRRADILPFRAGESDRRISPLEASSRYLKHLAEAWNHGMAKGIAEHRLELQDIVLTVPASFDAVARELTVEAARQAGFENLTLLEEPQAAFYAWLDGQGDEWRQQVRLGDLVLVADVGGGTTDFTLIEVGDDAGNLSLARLAVGDHLLLGGDNMDLALAHTLAAKLAAQGTKLDAGQMLQLTHGARQAKESLLSDATVTSAPIAILGKGRSVIGSSLKIDLTRSDVDSLLLQGFFPDCTIEAAPKRSVSSGLQELGLPYASDAGITRHLAHFLNRQAEALAQREKPGKKKKGDAAGLPTGVLFNGGVFQATSLKSRLLDVLNSWTKASKAEPARELQGADLDQAVARGAAYYGLVRRGKGVRIRGGTARAYYIGIESSAPAIPGIPAPIKALCVAPFGMEEGTEAELPKQEFNLALGDEVDFRFLASTTRRDDPPGTLVEDWAGQIDELQPVKLKLDGKADGGNSVPVHLQTKLTEVGQLELWCVSRDGKQKWKLEYNTRDSQGA